MAVLFRRSIAPCFILACFLAGTPPQCQGALNVGMTAAEDMVSKLRQSIFIETKYLQERKAKECSSLDGPRCLEFMGGRSNKASPWPAFEAVDAPGVIPELLLRDLGAEHGDLGVNFSTPDFQTLAHFYHQSEAATMHSSLPKLLAGFDDETSLRKARNFTHRGILHFDGVVPDRRVPLTFSSGLPEQVVATWDGRWIFKDCGSLDSCSNHKNVVTAGSPREAQFLALAPSSTVQSKAADAYAPLLVGKGGLTVGEKRFVSTVAELSGSVGYLRFSRPVIVRSLFARWRPLSSAAPAIVGGRLGLDVVWTTHLDPAKLRHRDGWHDLVADPLRPVDEITFLAAPGLEIGAVEVVAYGEEGGVVDERSVLLLAPMTAEAAAVVGLEREAGPTFALRLEALTPAAAPFVVSLQEAVEKNLRLHVGLPADHQLENQDSVSHASGTNQAMFDHQLIAQRNLPQLLGAAREPKAQPWDAAVRALASPSSGIPLDLRRDLAREQTAIVEAVKGYVRGGGRWHKNTPSILPQQGSEDALKRYMIAKRCQTKLDLLTAAFLHASAS